MSDGQVIEARGISETEGELRPNVNSSTLRTMLLFYQCLLRACSRGDHVVLWAGRGVCQKGYVSVPVGTSRCTPWLSFWKSFALLVPGHWEKVFPVEWDSCPSAQNCAAAAPQRTPPCPMPASACFTQSLSQDSEVWRVLNTTSDVANAIQGQGVPDHQVLPCSGAQHVQAFGHRLCCVFGPFVPCANGNGTWARSQPSTSVEDGPDIPKQTESGGGGGQQTAKSFRMNGMQTDCHLPPLPHHRGTHAGAQRARGPGPRAALPSKRSERPGWELQPSSCAQPPIATGATATLPNASPPAPPGHSRICLSTGSRKTGYTTPARSAGGPPPPRVCSATHHHIC